MKAIPVRDVLQVARFERIRVRSIAVRDFITGINEPEGIDYSCSLTFTCNQEPREFHYFQGGADSTSLVWINPLRTDHGCSPPLVPPFTDGGRLFLRGDHH